MTVSQSAGEKAAGFEAFVWGGSGRSAAPPFPIAGNREVEPGSRLPEGLCAVASDQTGANRVTIDPGKEPPGQQHMRYG